jgi:hypothetical protein
MLAVPLPMAAALEFGAEVIDDLIVAHGVPLTEPYPSIIKITNAELAGWFLANRRGAVSKPIGEMVDDARKRLARWATGVPVRGSAGEAQTSTNLAEPVNNPIGLPYSDPCGWRRYGGL